MIKEDGKIKEGSEKSLRVNEEIRSKEVRVIDENGQMIGIMPVTDALKIAYSRGLDLIEIAPNATPPVCKIMDYGKYLYGEKKKAQQAKKKQKVIVLKEIKMRPKIDEHDYQVKKRQMENFLKEGNKVKISIKFLGREISHPEVALELLNRISNELQDLAKVEKEPNLDNWSMVMVLAPKKS